MNKKVNSKHQIKRKSTNSFTVGKTFFDRMEVYLEKNKSKILYLILSLSLIFSVLLFDVKISIGNDDALYIEGGYRFANSFTHYYYTANAPFYPMFLALPIYIVGIKLIFLKTLSIIFNVLQLFFFYKAFKNKIPNLILFIVLLIMGINSYFLYFASQTYSESFFLFFQFLFLFSFMKLLENLEINKGELSKTYKDWLTIGLFSFILTFTKNIAMAVVPAMILFFIFNRQFLNATYSFLSFLIFKLTFEGLKLIIWGNTAQQYGAQSGLLMLKDPYDASQGKEDLAGFMGRFYDNSNLYLSKRIFQILGVLSEDSDKINGGLTFLVAILLLFGFIQIIRSKNKMMIFATLYMGISACTTFVALQARWDQPRIILIHLPIIMMVIFYGFYSIFKTSFKQYFFIFGIIIIIFSTCISTLFKAKKNIPIFFENLKGNIYKGYTPDWTNYLQMSEWCGKNLNDSMFVACRKAPMSFVYSKGKSFYPVYKVLSQDPDSILAIFKRNKVTHVLLGSLRRNPNKADGNYINTLHRMIQPVAEKYPDKIKLVHQIGQIEPAYLYEIKYK